MDKIFIDNQLTAIPSIDEWDKLTKGTINQIDGIIVLNNKIFSRQVEYCIQHNALNTEKTVGVLEKRNYRKIEEWWPTIIYWPNGCPKIEDMNGITLEKRLFFKVYFHKFHCFKCGLNADGYALERDSYKYDELNKVYDLFNFFALHCPNCGDSMQSPGLVEFTHIYNE